MLKDVTLGQYYKTDSFLHKLDPRTKIAGMLAFIIGVLISNSVATCIATLFCLALLIALSKVPIRYMFRGMKTLAFVLILVGILNALLVPGGVWRAIMICMKLVQIVLCSNLLTLTTKPREISNAIEKSLSWMSIFKVPVHDFATIISIAFSSISLLSDQASRIMDAQISRGADFQTRGFFAKAKASASIIIPVFVSAINRADDLAVAMDARLYGMRRPTRLHELCYTRFDAAAYVCIVTFLIVLIVMKVGHL